MTKSLWRASVVLLLSLLLAACGGAPAAVSTPGAAPTATTVIAKKVKPQPDALLNGTIEVGDKASKGTISLKVSGDGAAIASLEITLEELKCDGLSAGRVHDYLDGLQISISDGHFDASIPAVGREVENYNLETAPSAFPTVADLDKVGHIEGTFSSATQASGTIRIHMWVVMSDRACELGEFPWTAKAP